MSEFLNSLFKFLDHEGVPHHNNSSEGAIRILKVKTKVSGGFRTQAGAGTRGELITYMNG